MHVNRIVKSSLKKGLDIINLASGKPQDSGQNEHEAYSAPLNHWSIGIPVVDAILLVRTINTNATFVFGNVAIQFSFAMVRPISIELMCAHGQRLELIHHWMKLRHVSILKTSDFWLLSHYKFVAIMIMKHGRLTKNI